VVEVVEAVEVDTVVVEDTKCSSFLLSLSLHSEFVFTYLYYTILFFCLNCH
jgi:hypothetical protein